MHDCYYDRKKKFKSSVWRVRDCYYDRIKKIRVVCLAGARLSLRPEKKVLVVCLVGCAVVSVFGSGGKKVLVVHTTMYLEYRTVVVL